MIVERRARCVQMSAMRCGREVENRFGRYDPRLIDLTQAAREEAEICIRMARVHDRICAPNPHSADVGGSYPLSNAAMRVRKR